MPDDALVGPCSVVSLGTLTVNDSRLSNPGFAPSDQCYLSMRRRFDLQSVARRLLGPAHRVSGCFRLPLPNAQFVEVKHVPASLASASPRGSLHQVRVCGGIWCCPVCSSLITERRRKELQNLDKSARSASLRVVLVTLTFSHKRYDALHDSLEALLSAVRLLWVSGRSSMDFRQRWAIVGSVRALEVTHSEVNGWHPHCHLLVYLPTEVDLSAFGDAFRDRWMWALRRVGLSGNEHAFKLDDTNAAVADYLAKWGREKSWDEAAELTKHPVKRGHGAHMTPFDLLAAAGEGDTRAGDLFREYVRCFYRRRQMQATPGLYQLLLGDEAKTDDELLEETDVSAWVVALVRAPVYRLVPANDAVPELLQAAASGDFDQVANVCAAVGISLTDVFRGSHAVVASG